MPRRVTTLILLLFLNSHAMAMPGVKHDSVKVQGCWVHYFITGSGSPMVLLPGGPGMSHVSLTPLAELMALLPYEEIIIDFRGVGVSQAALTSANIGYEKIVEDIEAVRGKLGIKKWTVCGHSAGGQFAMYYTIKHPEAVSKLLLISPADADNAFQAYYGDNIQAHLTPEATATIAKYESAAEVKKDSMHAEYESKKALVTAYFFSPEKAKQFTDTLTQQTYFSFNSTPYFYAFIHSDEYAHFNINSQLKTIKIPTLIVQGRQDCLGAEIPIGLHERIAGSKLIFIDRCGHLPWLEQPYKLSIILASFLL